MNLPEMLQKAFNIILTRTKKPSKADIRNRRHITNYLRKSVIKLYRATTLKIISEHRL